MSNGFSGASRHLCRRRRWLSQLPEESPQDQIQPLRRARAKAQAETVVTPDVVTSVSTVSSIIPRRMWVLSLLVGCSLLAWAAVIGVGIWLDIQQIDPWRDIFGLQSGRLLRFFNSTALLTCSQLSFLILWRRSRSRKDFAGRYRVWFWVGAVCSIFCLATVSRFHEQWAIQLVGATNLVWADARVLCWLVPATTMLLSVMHLMRRDMPEYSASRHWVRASRILAVVAGVNLLIGSLFWTVQWVGPINAALGALWPTVFASSLLIHARFVTHVTNEASRESLPRRQPSRWETRLKSFARHVVQMAHEEWQVQRQRRAATKAAKATRTGALPVVTAPHSVSSSEKPSSPAKRRPAAVVPKADDSILEDSPATKAVNLRPRSQTAEEQPAATVMQPLQVHPAQPIPPPHFEISQGAEAEQMAGETDSESADSEALTHSSSIPDGYTTEQWRGFSKKERKRLQRNAGLR